MAVLPINRVTWGVDEPFKLAPRLGQHGGVEFLADDPVPPLVLFKEGGREAEIAEPAAAFPVHGLRDAAEVMPINHPLEPGSDMGVAVVAQLDHDPASAH